MKNMPIPPWNWWTLFVSRRRHNAVLLHYLRVIAKQEATIDRLYEALAAERGRNTDRATRPTETR